MAVEIGHFSSCPKRDRAGTIRDMCHAAAPSRRKREVLELVASGHANKEIAARMGITSWAVEKHLRQLYRRYDVPNRAALVTAAFRRGDLV